MKIVCFSKNFRDPSIGIVPFRSHYQHLQEALARIEDVSFYGKGFDSEIDVAKIVKQEKPDILYFMSKKGFKNIEKVKTPKIMFCADPWANILWHTKMLNKNKFSGALMLYPSAIPFYAKYTECKINPFPYWVDTKYFKNMNLKREYDVFCSGDFTKSYHPLRNKLLREREQHPDINFYLSRGHGLSFDHYVRMLNKSKIFCFDNVYLGLRGVRKTPKIRFAIEKWVEAMACNMLAMAPAPNSAEELHLRPGFNFVDVNTDNFMSKIKYYLEHGDERLRIARNGMETILKHHTVDVRLKQLIEIFNEALK